MLPYPSRPASTGSRLSSTALGHSKLRHFRQRLFRQAAEDKLPLTVRHERIYILPTRRGWLFLSSLGMMLIASINYGLGLGYVLCFLMTGLFASALIATYRNLAGITLTRIEAANVRCTEPIRWQLCLHPGNSAAATARHGIEVHAGGFHTAGDLDDGPLQLTLSVPSERRGWQPLGRMRLTSDYPLGLWHTWSYLHTPHQALVLPQAEADAPPLPDQAPDNGSRLDHNHVAEQSARHRVASSGEFHALRPYRNGDTPAIIAWKTLAHGKGLQSKEFVATIEQQELTIGWAASLPAGDIEQRIRRLTAWVELAFKNGAMWSLQLPDKTLEAASGREHFDRSMRALAEFAAPSKHLAAGQDRTHPLAVKMSRIRPINGGLRASNCSDSDYASSTGRQ